MTKDIRLKCVIREDFFSTKQNKAQGKNIKIIAFIVTIIFKLQTIELAEKNSQRHRFEIHKQIDEFQNIDIG